MSLAARVLAGCCVALALLASACGAEPPPITNARDESPGLALAGDFACPAEEALLGSTCWGATGTRWHVDARGPGERYEFDLTLLGAGRVRSTDHAAAGPASDEWFQQGEVLRVFLADRFVEYRARIGNGTVLTGEARNVRGQRWSWRADRDFEEAACARSETLVGDVCTTVEGTRWRLEHEGRHQTLEFLADGVLGVGSGDPDATQLGTWSQRDEAVRFAFEASATTFRARFEDADRMSGTVVTSRPEAGVERPFAAVREPSLAPP